MPDSRKVDINAWNCSQFAKKFGERASLQGFVNDLIQKYFEGSLINLDEAVLEKVKILSEPGQLNRAPADVVNYILYSFNFVVDKTEIPVVKLPVNRDKIRIKKIGGNKVTEWE